MKIVIYAFIIQCMFYSVVSAQAFRLETADFRLSISEIGQIKEMASPISGKNYLAPGHNAPILKIRIGNEWEEPSKAFFNSGKGLITLHFSKSGTDAEIKVEQKKTHMVFELIGVSPLEQINAVIWGSFPTLISKTIGEVVGVVRDDEYAIGLQSLNTKTLGGVLTNAEGADFTRGTVAIAQAYGSSLQAYSLDRSKPRKILVWDQNYPNMPVDLIPNETVLGSKIALFGCEEKKTLNRIGEIELSEGLPHPTINGAWIKQAPETGRAYLISDFNESNIDDMLKYTQQAGLISLYHEGPFKSWGHFILDPKKFPNGNAGMKTCVEKAEKIGLRIGTHTLTSFINTNDPYVTPVPDPRLALTGSSILTQNISDTTLEIPVDSDEYFRNLKPSTLHLVRIGEEIVRFREVSKEPPYKLLDCQRGAYYTKASAHLSGESVGMMLDYPYRTLFPNFELQQEIAGNLARFFNETGVSHMDFDGHEGCYSSGEGDYGVQAFAEKVFRETNHTLVNGTSRSSHFYWHICHYWNWGEPWYGGFRESQGDYRLENQPLLERNYMPNMLGWFLLSPTTGPEDIEWMMARAAGYHAGFALVAAYNSLKKNPNTDELLNLINIWQEASLTNIFNADQKARLKNPDNDFHLEKTNQEWKLFPYKKYKFEHAKLLLQPGQPTFSEWEFENKDDGQSLTFSMTIMGKEGIVSNPWIELDAYNKMEFQGEFKAGNSIVCDGKSFKLYNEKGSFDSEINTTHKVPVLSQGKHQLKFDCDFQDDSELKIRFVLKTISSPEIISR